MTYPVYYTPTYGTFATPGAGAFPAAPLQVTCELDLAGTWTDITGYSLQAGDSAGRLAAYAITRGRQDESSTSAVPQSLAFTLANTDGRFSPRNPTGPYFGQLGRNTPVRVSVPTSGTWLRLADDAVSYISCPDTAALQITGSLDVRIDVNLDNWVPSVLCSKWGASGKAWALALNADGSVTFTWNDGFVVHQASCTTLATVPLGRSMIRATLNQSTGTVQFWTAATMAGSQTLLATITGSGSTSVAAAAGQPVAVGDSATYDGTYGTQGCQGQVYEFQLYSGIGGTLKADPVFSSQTPGATPFADAQGNTWTMAGTAVLSNRSYRFHGEISSIPQAWDVTGHDVTTPVTAAGMLRRAQQGSAPVKSVMRRGIQAWPSGPSASASSASSPLSTIAYWPCEDNAGTTSIAAGMAVNSDGLVVSPLGISGTAAFGGSAGSSSADSVFACSAVLGQPQSSQWAGSVPPYSSSCQAWAVTFLVSVPSGGLPNSVLLVAYMTGGGSVSYLAVTYNTAAGGELSMDVGGTATVTGPAGANGQAYLVQLANDGTGTATCYMSWLPLGLGQSAFQVSHGSNAGNVAAVKVNVQDAALSSGEIGHIWVTAAFASAGSHPALPVLSSAKMASLLNAYAGEAAGTRFARLCSENGLPSRVYGYPAVTAAMGAQQVDTLANILQSVEDADRGQVFESRNALALGYRTQASLCSQAAAFTLDFTLDEVAPPLAPTDDDQLLRNDAVVSRNGGSSAQVQVTTGPLSVNDPPNGAGDYQTSLTVYCLTDMQLPQIASWITHVGTANYERFPQAGVDLASSDTAVQALLPLVRDSDIGTFFTLANMPGPWLPPDAARQLLWGYTELLGDFAWMFTLNGVPEIPYETAVTGTGAADSAHADTDGSALHTAVSSSATTLSVSTTNAGSPVWTTTAADFPFDIAVGGERMTVTNITGATSPQSFTVTRSVNGVTKAQSAGTAIALWHTPYLALSGPSGAT